MHMCFLVLDVHAHADTSHNDIQSFDCKEIQHPQILMDFQVS